MLLYAHVLLNISVCVIKYPDFIVETALISIFDFDNAQQICQLKMSSICNNDVPKGKKLVQLMMKWEVIEKEVLGGGYGNLPFHHELY